MRPTIINTYHRRKCILPTEMESRLRVFSQSCQSTGCKKFLQHSLVCMHASIYSLMWRLPMGMALPYAQWNSILTPQKMSMNTNSAADIFKLRLYSIFYSYSIQTEQ